jgi:hypothetical protein
LQAVKGGQKQADAFYQAHRDQFCPKHRQARP